MLEGCEEQGRGAWGMGQEDWNNGFYFTTHSPAFGGLVRGTEDTEVANFLSNRETAIR
jgi:hypothetical protein